MIPTNDEELQKEFEGVWKSEVDTLDEISGLSHPNLIQRIAAISRGRQRYLMFLWAEGGNLRDFWTRYPKPEVKADLVRAIIEQLRGMAHALQKLHEYRGQYHYRHGDIKPENILNFPDPKKSRIGTFKISDLGSAKHHNVVTQLRERTRGKTFATIVYQPPESVTNKLSASSRLYDIWSMGCVTLEFVVWLLYGYEELKQFKLSIKGELEESSPFFIVKDSAAEIHPAVQSTLDRLSRDPECSSKTALGDLLDIVKTRLLVVALPERTESNQGLENVSIEHADSTFKTRQPFQKYRISAAGFVNALDDILENENPGYWFTGRSRDNMRIPPIKPNIIVEDRSSLLSPGWRPQSGPIADPIKSAASPYASDSDLAVPYQIRNVSA